MKEKCKTLGKILNEIEIRNLPHKEWPKDAHWGGEKNEWTQWES